MSLTTCPITVSVAESKVEERLTCYFRTNQYLLNAFDRCLNIEMLVWFFLVFAARWSAQESVGVVYWQCLMSEMEIQLRAEARKNDR